MHIGSSELLLIILLVLVLFGANRFPRIMENFANGIKSFKKTMKKKNTPNPKSTRISSTKTKVKAKTGTKSKTKKK